MVWPFNSGNRDLALPATPTAPRASGDMSDGAIVDGNFCLDNTDPPKTGMVLPLFSLKGKTAIVTGAGAGIGLAVAHGFAEAGANVAIWYNTNKAALDRAAEIEKIFGVKCMSVVARIDLGRINRTS